MDKIKKQFGQRLKQIRREHGITQEQLAEKIKVVSRTVSCIERGVSFIKSETLSNLCVVFKKPAQYFFEFDEISKSAKSKNDILNSITGTLQYCNDDELKEIKDFIEFKTKKNP